MDLDSQYTVTADLPLVAQPESSLGLSSWIAAGKRLFGDWVDKLIFRTPCRIRQLELGTNIDFAVKPVVLESKDGIALLGWVSGPQS